MNKNLEIGERERERESGVVERLKGERECSGVGGFGRLLGLRLLCCLVLVVFEFCESFLTIIK